MRTFAPWWLRRLFTAVVGIVVLFETNACSESLRPAGPSPAAAEANADLLFGALRARFTGVELAPEYEAARVKLAKSALVPSRIFGDDDIWGARPSPSVRVLYVAGNTVGGRYRLEARPSLDEPLHPGDTRHTITLDRKAASVFEWNTTVDMAIGTVSAEEMSVVISTLFRAAEGRSERDLRADYRTSFPRATAVFGHGFSIDTLRSVPGAAGTTSVTLTIGFHPELMRSEYPAFAGYLDKYVAPAKYHLLFADRSGLALLDAVGRDRSVTLRYRVQQGKLTSLFGPPRPWPDSLQLTADVSAKVKLFTVGFHGLLTDFVISHTGHERAWTLIAQREPKWDLPFVAERLLRSPLHRPFEGSGALFQVSVRDTVGHQTVFSRRARIDVQESTIMRFLGSLGSRAVGDLDETVALEERRFLSEGFAALQADVRGIRGRWQAGDRERRPPESKNATEH